MPDGESVVFRAIVRTSEVVMGDAPDEVGDIVVKIVVTNWEALTLPLVEVADAAFVRDAVAEEAGVEDCAWAARTPKRAERRYLTRMALCSSGYTKGEVSLRSERTSITHLLGS